MAGERRFTRIPPESSGDRVSMTCFLEVPYYAANNTFRAGETVTFVSSGLSGQVAYSRADTANTGIFVMSMDANSRENNLVATTGEVIQIDGVGAALASNTGIEIYQNKFSLASGSNPQYMQLVDQSGAAYMRFTEGPAQLDSFGKLRTSETYVLGEYTFTRKLPSDVNGTTVGTGQYTHDATTGVGVLTCGTASGDVAQATTNLYHPYFPGVSQNILMTVYVGDTGKTNVRREWGYFDDNNGVFFRLDGTSLSVVKRSNVSGSPVDTPIAQADWNTDNLTGVGGAENRSLVNIDVSKINLYWIDFEWLGGGKVRWGIFNDGQRITCHSENYGNVISGPYMKTGSLPIRWRQTNTGTAGSSSELRIVCAAVHTEQNLPEPHEYGEQVVVNFAPANVNSTANIYLHTIRTIAGTHDTYLPVEVALGAFDTSNSSESAIKLDFYTGCTLSGSPSFANISGTSIEYDTSASGVSGGTYYGTIMFKGVDIKTAHGTTWQRGAYKCLANGTPTAFTVLATRLDGAAANASVTMTYTLKEFLAG